MIQNICYDNNDDVIIEVDDEGAEYLIDGLSELCINGPGAERSTPAVWGKPAPWWRFWDRSETPMIGQFILRHVGEE